MNAIEEYGYDKDGDRFVITNIETAYENGTYDLMNGYICIIDVRDSFGNFAYSEEKRFQHLESVYKYLGL